MSKKGHSEEQILRALRQAESGTRVSDICREHGIWTYPGLVEGVGLG
jgi:transposase-like protein